jgi:hypothetical protein
MLPAEVAVAQTGRDDFSTGSGFAGGEFGSDAGT